MTDTAYYSTVDPFHFAPQSPPPSSSLANGLPPFPSSASLAVPQSQISPALYSPEVAVSSASIAQSIADNLGPKSPLRVVDDAMEGVSAHSAAAPGAALKASPSASTTPDLVQQAKMDVEDDHHRRGPPLSDTPGGDCRNVCIRHARMANGSTNLMLQKVRLAPSFFCPCRE